MCTVNNSFLHILKVGIFSQLTEKCADNQIHVIGFFQDISWIYPFYISKVGIYSQLTEKYADNQTHVIDLSKIYTENLSLLNIYLKLEFKNVRIIKFM